MNTADKIEIVQSGLTPYAAGLELQAAAADRVRAGEIPGVIIVIRHPAVVTLGHRGALSEIHLPRAALAERGIEFFTVDRGGGATFHYPEQSVLYPILDLSRLGLTVSELLVMSGRAVMDNLAAHGVNGVWDESRPGVYMPGGAKIASIGFHLCKSITTHGIAINTGAGREGFDLIDPCKVRGQPVTSILDETGTAPDPDAFGMAVAMSFRTLLATRPRPAR